MATTTRAKAKAGDGAGRAAVEPLAVRPEAAFALLGISRAYGYRLLASGVLPSVKVGGARLVPTGALRAWLDGELARQRSA